MHHQEILFWYRIVQNIKNTCRVQKLLKGFQLQSKKFNMGKGMLFVLGRSFVFFVSHFRIYMSIILLWYAHYSLYNPLLQNKIRGMPIEIMWQFLSVFATCTYGYANSIYKDHVCLSRYTCCSSTGIKTSLLINF